MNSVKRVLRVAWILSSKQLCRWADDYQALAGAVCRPATNLELWIELSLEVLLPVVGVVAEGVRWSFAKWVNVGYPLAAASLWLGEAAR